MNAAATTRTRPAWQVVALRELAVKARDKNFIMSLLLTLVLVAGSFGVQIWLAGRTQATKIAVVSAQNGSGPGGEALVRAAQKLAEGDGEKVRYEPKSVASASEARADVKDGHVDVALLPEAGGWQLLGDKDVDSGVTKRVTQAAAQETLAANAKAQHVDLAKLTSGAKVTTSQLAHGDVDSGVAKVVAMIFAFLFYFVAFVFGLPIAQSVVEEKQSRIVEILASAIPLKHLLAGKVIGNAVLAITQVTLLVGVALIGLSQTKWSSFIGTVAGASGWFILFFLAGFLVVACLFAVAGALASRSEDVQTTAQPVTMLVVVVLMLGLVLKGTALKVASFVPVVSTVAMPARVIRGDAAWWEPLLALVIAGVAAVLITRVATRLYTRSVMQTGGRLSYKEAFRLQV